MLDPLERIVDKVEMAFSAVQHVKDSFSVGYKRELWVESLGFLRDFLQF